MGREVYRLARRIAQRNLALHTPAVRAMAAPAVVSQKSQEALDVTFPNDPEAWLRDIDPTLDPLSDYHRRAWDWLWSLRRGVRPRTHILILSRGFGKSTTAEMGVAAVAARRSRRYAWYVSGTQDLADEHVASVSEILLKPAYSVRYPWAATRALSPFGTAKGWRRNRLYTASGFIVDALGLDTAARGRKIDGQRPDFIIFDDVDDSSDSDKVIENKKNAITRKIILAKSDDCAFFGCQNLPHENGIFAQLADGRADFLLDRRVDGPHPAVENLEVERRIDRETGARRYFYLSGRITWPAKTPDDINALITDGGYSAFLRECQHEKVAEAGGLFSHIDFDEIEIEPLRRDGSNRLPDFVRTVLWVDPAVSNLDGSDAYAITVGSITERGRIWFRYAWESKPGQKVNPDEISQDEWERMSSSEQEKHITASEAVLSRAILKAIEYRALHVGVETDQGGNTWFSVYQRAIAYLRRKGLISKRTRIPPFASAKAGTSQKSKIARFQQMQAEYDYDLIRHVAGTTKPLRDALWRAPTKPIDTVDSAWHTWKDLRYGLAASSEQMTTHSRTHVR